MVAGAARAAEPPTTLAAALLDRGQAGAALALLDALDAARVEDGAARSAGELVLERDFLRGRAAFDLGRYRDAAMFFRVVVEGAPESPRPRLELARAYFEAGEDAKAAHHFSIALGFDLPPAAASRAQAYLAAIRDRRAWRFALALAAAPDSNANAATGATQVNLRGLAFELDDDAQPRSGVGLIARAQGSYRARLGEGRVIEAALSGNHEDQPGGDLDQSALRFELGPRQVSAEGERAIEAVLGRRWIGGEAYDLSFGAQWSADRRLFDDVAGAIRVYLGARRHDQDDRQRRDALETEIETGVNYSHPLLGLLDANLALNAAAADADDESRIGASATLGTYKELPMALSVFGEATLGFSHRLADDPAFLERRNDLFGQARLGLLSRRFELLGFTPTITGVAESRLSSIDLYDYDRLRLEVGASRRF